MDEIQVEFLNLHSASSWLNRSLIKDSLHIDAFLWFSNFWCSICSKRENTVVLEVNSAALFLFQDTLKCEYYLVSCALQRLTWTSCLAIWSEIIHVNSQSHAVDLWKNETSNGKRKEIARSRNNLSRKIQMFFWAATFLLELLWGSCQEK